MSDKEQFVFKDKDLPPTDDLILQYLGASGHLWQSVMSYISESCDDTKGTWNWYNDGKQWLFKVVRKKKTIFWASVLEGGFRITFYFGGKAEPAIRASAIRDDLKDQYMTGPRYGQIRAITLRPGNTNDISEIEKLIALKMKIN
ncbi:MAG: DUF3788 domain-containing protein [Bacteroidales bacterium]|jgi:hypothetical protein|nr:DUF3788 domain-containing protein [Bacteroidales bacterium]